MPYVYILQSINYGTYYIGSTTFTVEQRLHKHNSGRVISTRPRKPWKLIHSEIYATLSEARKRERQIKAWKDRNAIERLIRNKKVIVPGFL